MAFDLDGVIVAPPLPYNLAISRRLDLPPLPSEVRESALLADRRRTRRLLSLGMEMLRAYGRRPMPDARQGLLAIREYRVPIAVTGRHWVGRGMIARWLRCHGLDDLFAVIYPNSTDQPSPLYKLWRLRQRGISEHVDDDGATAYYLARNGVAVVYLRDWHRNRGLPYPANVRTYRRLEEVAEDLARRSRRG